LKLREYLACGRPVVASDVPGEAQLAREIGAGLLYEPANPEELADRICMILQDQQLARQMGENGRRNVVEQGTWRHVAEKLLMIAEEAIDEVNQRRESEKAYREVASESPAGESHHQARVTPGLLSVGTEETQ
ncbi:MAG: glycosyltransferase, partial [Dehalococcoidia bacterium]